MKLGHLEFVPAARSQELVAPLVNAVLGQFATADVLVTAIDPALADTAAFCQHYDIGLEVSVNCVVLEAKRADKTWYAAILVRATDRADVNGIIRRHLDARKISFAPMDTAVRLTAMEYGGITPLGLPADWPILIDAAAAALDWAVIGSGRRASKLLVPGRLMATLPHAQVMTLTLAPRSADV